MMARGTLLSFLVLGSICTLSRSTAHNRRYHIHQHNGEVTSLNSSDIVREEGIYFLNQLFEKYGSGNVMDLTAVESVLRDIGYESSHDHEEGNSSEHEEHTDHENKRNHFLPGKGQAASEHRDEDEPNDETYQRHIHDNEKQKVEKTSEDDQFDSEGSGHEDKQTEDTGHDVIEKEGKPTEQVDTDHPDSDIVKSSEDSEKSSSKHHANDNIFRGDDLSHEHEENTEHHVDKDTTGHSEHGAKNDTNVEGDTINHNDGQGNTEQDDHMHTEAVKSDKRHPQNEKTDNHKREHEHALSESNNPMKGGKHHKHDTASDGPGLDQGNQKPSEVDSFKERHNDKDKIRTGKWDGKKRKGKGRKRKNQKGSGKSQQPQNIKPDAKQRNKRTVVFHSHDVHSDCMTVNQLLKNFHVDQIGLISRKDFLYMSPAIVYQMSKPRCRRIEASSVRHAHGSKQTTKSGIPAKVWGFSSLTVFIISLVGLMAVALVPVIKRLFFDNLIQFLVAMAVGALTGDAMLHLLPHAIDTGHGSGGGDHKTSLWKGLSALAAIYFFFIIQRIMGIITGVRNKRRQKRTLLRKKQSLTVAGEGKGLSRSSSSNTEDEGESDLEQTTKLEKKMPGGHHEHTLENNEDEDHGHSHGPAPTSVSAIAMMIVLGDGIHNFSDGLAIGVAFGSSITSGISTGIAVFCHELPHEIGDFAVLLKSGMSVKRAIQYNCVSSVFCFIGMLIGVALGNMEAASSWIFAAVGGMFIYISLVTMMPELSSSSSRPGRILLLQLAGMGVGSGIMLLIAVFEDDLKSVLG